MLTRIELENTDDAAALVAALTAAGCTAVREPGSRCVDVVADDTGAGDADAELVALAFFLKVWGSTGATVRARLA